MCAKYIRTGLKRAAHLAKKYSRNRNAIFKGEIYLLREVVLGCGKKYSTEAVDADNI